MKNKTVQITYQRKNVKGLFGRNKTKLVKTGKTVTKTNVKGKSELDVIAGMKGADRVKALRSRNINRTLTGLNITANASGNVLSAIKNLSNASKYDSKVNQNINGGMQPTETTRSDDEEETETKTGTKDIA